MIQLMSKYLAEGKVYEALLVGQNIAFKNCNKANFEVYWNLLIKLSKETDDLLMASKYVEQANALIAFFAENMELDEMLVAFIVEKRQQLDIINSKLHQKVLEKEQELIDANVKKNNEYLNLINKLAENIIDIDDEEQFKKRLEQIRLIDIEILKDYLTSEQKNEYERLTKKCSQIVAEKTSYFEHKKNVDYNNKAVEAYERAFDFIKTGKGFDAHLDIIKEMFAFDASRLFAETIIYYNHVYTYIFSKLTDDEKLMFTKVAINLSKKR